MGNMHQIVLDKLEGDWYCEEINVGMKISFLDRGVLYNFKYTGDFEGKEEDVEVKYNQPSDDVVTINTEFLGHVNVQIRANKLILYPPAPSEKKPLLFDRVPDMKLKE